MAEDCRSITLAKRRAMRSSDLKGSCLVCLVQTEDSSGHLLTLHTSNQFDVIALVPLGGVYNHLSCILPLFQCKNCASFPVANKHLRQEFGGKYHATLRGAPCTLSSSPPLFLHLYRGVPHSRHLVRSA